MKTEQEQIEKMARTMCGYCSTDGKCAVSKNGREPDICANVDTQHCLYKEYAERLIDSNYGKVSEYKAEIERLKAENDANMQYIRMMGIQSHIKTSNERVKQAQIDTINTIVEYCENPNHWNELKDCKLWGGKSDDLRDFLNGIFKEIENEN